MLSFESSKILDNNIFLLDLWCLILLRKKKLLYIFNSFEAFFRVCVVCSALHSSKQIAALLWKSFLEKFAFLCILTMMNGVYLETPKLLRDVVVYRTVLFLLFWNSVFLWPVKLMFGNLLGHFCTCTTVRPARVLVSMLVRGIWFHSPYHHNR